MNIPTFKHDFSAFTAEQIETIAHVAGCIQRDIRRKQISLRGLRALKAEAPLYNPYHTNRRQITSLVWLFIAKHFTKSVDETCAAMIELAQAANYAAELLTVLAEPAAEIDGLTPDEIAERMDKEAGQLGSTRPTARGYLIRHISSLLSNYEKNGLKLEESTVHYFLDSLRVYGIIGERTRNRLYNIIRKAGSMAGNYEPERQARIIDAMIGTLRSGQCIETAITQATR